MSTPKILYVIEKIAPEKAGAGINLHHFLEFGRREFDARVLAVGSTIPTGDNDISNDYYRLQGLNKGLFKRCFYQFLAIPKLVKHIFWSDIVHIKSIPKGMVIISVLAKMMGKKLIQEPTLVGHDDPKTFSQYKSGKLQHFCWKISDSSVFISDDVKLHSLNYPGEIISRGVDLNKFTFERNDRKREELGISNSTLVVTQIGNISDRKNQLKTLEIIAELQENTSFKFIVYLVGPDSNQGYKNRLLEFAAEHSINCCFTGYTTDVQQYLEISDLYVFPSKDEGFGVSLIQALASGLNTYTSPVGCYKELEALGFNNVIDGDASAWGKHIKEDLEVKKIIRKDNNKLVESFSEQNVAKKLHHFYSNILSK